MLTADDGAEGDQFGYDVAVDGDVMVAGAPYDDNTNGNDAGAAYVYQLVDNEWVLQTKLIASDGAESVDLGYSVAIDGDYIVVGCPWDDDLGEKAGAAYVFHKEGNNWVEQAKLQATDGTEDDRLGIAVDIYDDTIVAGAFFDDVEGDRSGSAYVFVRDGSTWEQQAKLVPDDATAGDWFGVGVSIYNDDIAVSARQNDDVAHNAGAVYMFSRSGTNWSQDAKIVTPDGTDNDEFGNPCIYGNTLIVGADRNDEKGYNAGAFYHYQRGGSTWDLQAKYTASDANSGDHFGSSFAITPKYLVVGAYLDDMSGESSGSMYLYKREGYSYIEIGKITASNVRTGDNYGLNVSMSDSFIVAGARYQDEIVKNAGAAYIYKLKENPQLVSVQDVPYDQGGYVELTWNAAFFDFARNLSYYSIWSTMDGDGLGKANTLGATRTFLVNGQEQTWRWIANVPGHRNETYGYVAPTLNDAMDGNSGLQSYMVSAHLQNHDFFHDSNVMTGSSVDNLAPSVPAGLAASSSGGNVYLNWGAASVSDFSHYVVYRDGDMLNHSLENAFIDRDVFQDQNYAYRVAAVDVHGNASELSEDVSVIATEIATTKNQTPKTFQLYHNHPNPFNAGTVIQFAVPQQSHAELRIYNTLGQEIKTLVDAEYLAGIHQVHWDGTDNLGQSVASGIYVCVFQAGDFLAKQQMNLLK